MTLDAHQHFWKYDPVEYAWISEAMPVLKRDWLPEDLLPLLQKQGFDGCVAVQARQTEAETEFLLERAAAHDFIKAVVGWVDLQADQVESRLSYFQQFSKMKGFRHIVQDEPDERFLLQKRFINGVQLLQQYHYTYDILVYERQLPVVLQFLEYFDNQQFVLDHLGKPDLKQPIKKSWKDAMYALAQYPNLYCKISGLVTEAQWNGWTAEDFKPFLYTVFDAFDVNRVMVGSDWPVCLLAAPDYASVLEIVADFIQGFSEADKRKVFGENATRWYRVEGRG